MVKLIIPTVETAALKSETGLGLRQTHGDSADRYNIGIGKDVLETPRYPLNDLPLRIRVGKLNEHIPMPEM